MKEKKVGLQQLEAFGIKPAGPREWIPVEGIHFPHVDTKHNLSAGLQQVAFPYVSGTEDTFRKKAGLTVLTEALKKLHQSPSTQLFALACDNDTLYEHIIVPAINTFAHPGKHVLIPDIGYPIMDWWKKGLEKSGNSLVEGDFFSLMQKGKLPESIKAVYIDFPGTFFSAKYSPKDLAGWMGANPDVLFIVDQANLGFFNPSSQESSFDLLTSGSSRQNLILTTTTTKAFSVRVLAQAWASKGFAQTYGNGEVPLTKGLTHGHIQTAVQAFHPANIAQAENLRQTIVGYRETLKQKLIQKYGVGSVYNPEATQGHALIVSGKALGFGDGDGLSKALAIGAARKDGVQAIPIGVKSTKYYTDVSKHPWVKDYVYISIPFDTQVMQDLCVGLGVAA